MAAHAAAAFILDTAAPAGGPLLNVARPRAPVVLVAYVPRKGDHVGAKVPAAKLAHKVKAAHAPGPPAPRI